MLSSASRCESGGLRLFRAFHHGSLSCNVHDLVANHLTFGEASSQAQATVMPPREIPFGIGFVRKSSDSDRCSSFFSQSGHSAIFGVLDRVSARLRPGMQTPMMYAQWGRMAGYLWRCWSLRNRHVSSAAYTARSFPHSFHDSGIRTLTVLKKHKESTCTIYVQNLFWKRPDPKNGWLGQFSRSQRPELT